MKKKNQPKKNKLRRVDSALLFDEQDYWELVRYSDYRGYIHPENKPAKKWNRKDFDDAVRDSINNLVRDYLDMRSGYTDGSIYTKGIVHSGHQRWAPNRKI